MNYEKISKFIKLLREEQGLSQESLANLIYMDRSKINKIENGKRKPQLEDIIALSEVFNISIEELLLGERKSKENVNLMNHTTKTFLKEQNNKLKKLKFIIGILLIIILIIFISLTTLYFFQNYRSIRIYKVTGAGNNYKINDGILILSKKKTYFTINNITPKVEKIEILSEINNKKKTIYNGDVNQILNDFYGYNAFISYDDFLNSNQNIYVKIKEEEIKLEFTEDFVNDDFFYEKKDVLTKEEEILTSNEMPEKIKKTFKCDELTCILEKDGEIAILNNNILTVTKDDITIIYDIPNSTFFYDKAKKLKFTILNNKVSCQIGNCEKASNLYNDFINKYFK